ncbi:MAG: FAD/NAD(P)-binding protein, partial [Rubrivivax sp.]|nr:FAD/NAD(P)-binding protein [Rubrivivax sp.]
MASSDGGWSGPGLRRGAGAGCCGHRAFAVELGARRRQRAAHRSALRARRPGGALQHRRGVPVRRRQRAHRLRRQRLRRQRAHRRHGQDRSLHPLLGGHHRHRSAHAVHLQLRLAQHRRPLQHRGEPALGGLPGAPRRADVLGRLCRRLSQPGRRPRPDAGAGRLRHAVGLRGTGQRQQDGQLSLRGDGHAIHLHRQRQQRPLRAERRHRPVQRPRRRRTRAAGPAGRRARAAGRAAAPPRLNTPVVIVGGGFTGCCLAVQLVRHAPRPLRVVVVDPAERPGRGLAYRTADPDHRLNAPTFGHSLLPDDAWHLSRWVVAHRLRESDPECLRPDGTVYLRRGDFGRYLEATFDAHRQGAASGSVIEHRRARAVALSAPREPLAVHLDDGTALAAAQVLLATGNP